MGSDLVARLRDVAPGYGKLRLEAADEIERLRAEIRHLFAVADKEAQERGAALAAVRAEGYAAGQEAMRERAADHVAECLAALGLPFGVESIRALPLTPEPKEPGHAE